MICVLTLTSICTAAESPDDLRVKADKGDAAAQYDLGFSYAYGQSVTKDEAEAVKWY